VLSLTTKSHTKENRPGLILTEEELPTFNALPIRPGRGRERAASRFSAEQNLIDMLRKLALTQPVLHACGRGGSQREEQQKLDHLDKWRGFAAT
jgi:hypothetical protein